MNKDQVNGRMETAKGNVKEAAGKVVGNDRLAAEGRADQAAGKVQSTAGDLKNKAGNAIKNAIDR
ncbi:MAG TPA: CsbD family protein [Burkholderiaceae bacterium]